MTLIDQRILIDAPSDVVWGIVSDPARVAGWHAGYTSISVLTTQPVGVGSRRRCTLKNGKSVIEEVTAWVDGLGYEVSIVDGGPYREYQGRIRLQPGPDGTSVQWTISYRRKGVLGGVKDWLSGRRQMAEMMAASLRQLRRQVDDLGRRMQEDDRARFLIQGRLNVDQRAQYQRRHPTPPAVEAVMSAPLSPKPANAQPEPEPVPAAPVPSFVATLTSDPPDPDYDSEADTKPKAPPGLREAIEAGDGVPSFMRVTPARGTPIIKPDEPPSVIEAPEPEPPGPPQVDTQPSAPPPAVELAHEELEQAVPAAPEETPLPEPEPVVPPEVIAPPAPAAPRTPTPPTPVHGIPKVDIRAAQEMDAEQRANLPPPTPKTDTGEMSIWEVFGMRRPSSHDQDALDDLMRSIQSKEIAERLIDGRISKRPTRVRRARTVLGLRLRLILNGVRVRLHR